MVEGGKRHQVKSRKMELETESNRDRGRDQNKGIEMGKEQKRYKDSDGDRDI